MINYEYRGGRVAGTPELKATQNGTPYLRFRMANDDSSYNDQTEQWDKKAEHFITVIVWPTKRKGEMVDLPTMLAESLRSGSSVQVWGKFATRSWETEVGSRRSVEEFAARAVAVDVLDVLQWQPLAEAQQGAGNAGGAQQVACTAGGGRQWHAWGAGNAPGEQQQQQDATWGTPAQPGGGVPY